MLNFVYKVNLLKLISEKVIYEKKSENLVEIGVLQIGHLSSINWSEQLSHIATCLQGSVQRLEHDSHAKGLRCKFNFTSFIISMM